VTAADPADLQVQLSASDLPAGASFDAASGNVDWTPSATASGKYTMTFIARNTAGQSSSTQVTIDVTSGAPTLATLERACSPGAVASLSGSSLSDADSAVSDPSGQAIDLGGTKVKLNGQYVPVLSVSRTSVYFACPTISPGTPLDLAVETGSGVSGTLSTVMQSASPWIFALGSSSQKQGVVSFVGTTDLAMERNSQIPAHPAQPGDEILLWGTGFGEFPSSAAISVNVGGVDTNVEAVRAVPGHAGAYTVLLRVPVPAAFGDSIPVHLEMIGADGKAFNSNSVTIAVEAVQQ
jgi:uncharacterized protein (TIGR03437 family)